jgi:S-adenosylmethionine:tRNA ribosyltransferase-isomerase
LKTSDFDYQLPAELIAQEPIEPRDASRLLVLNRRAGQSEHRSFDQIGDFLQPGDLLVVNRSRVVPARLSAKKIPGGGKAEILLLERINPTEWKALVGGKGLEVGKKLELENGVTAEITADLGGSQRLILFDKELAADLEAVGKVPLPPYIHAPLQDRDRYQTVYAKEHGSAAAPTAGLHFTSELIDKLKAQGIGFAEVTLHIGLDTFAPVTEENADEHLIHSEWCSLSAEAADAVNATRHSGGRVIAVGTTSVRVLETAAQGGTAGLEVNPFEGRTRLFILPGYQFRLVDGLLTNFHLPRSTLLMLVSAFAGRDLILETYRKAIKEKYRFYSFGDAMLIL